MRPVLEKRPVIVVECAQMLAPVARRAGEQDHVVGALDRVDRIELDEAELPHEAERLAFAMCLCPVEAQRMVVEEKAARLGVADFEFLHEKRIDESPPLRSPGADVIFAVRRRIRVSVRPDRRT